MKHKMGYKLLRDSENFYLCLLEATGKIIANDIKYRTNEVFIHQIIKIHNLKKIKSVGHINFYDFTKIQYIENQYILSDLNYSSEICSKGINYFPITGTYVENFFIYFRQLNLNFSNICIILDKWISDISNLDIKKEN